MNRFLVILFLLTGFVAGGETAHAQLSKKAEEFVRKAFEDNPADSLAASGDFQVGDSVSMEEMELRLQEMRLTEIMLRTQLAEATEKNNIADSIKRAARLHEIDSLRSITPGMPVVVDGDTLFRIYASMGGRSAMERAGTISKAIAEIGKSRRLSRDSLHILDNENYLDIMYGDKVIMSVTEKDALWLGTTPQELAKSLIPILDAKIKYLSEENSLWQFVRRGGMFVLVIIIQVLIFKLINYLFRKFRKRIIDYARQRESGLVIRDYEILNTRTLTRLIMVVSNLLRYAILLLVLILTVPILFAIFPQTENLAMKIFHYIIDPVKMVVKGVVEYIPNLFIIVVIWYSVRYIIKGIRYLSNEIESEKLKINGFYPEWAQPTFNIIRFLLYAFMIAMIYPYLPGAHSGVFQGISVFVGLIVSLGSSTVIANFIAGFVITYMRPFHNGDFIKVKDTVGNVIEKTPFVTRIRTIKNEVVTIPNSFIMSSDTVNYSASARRYGLIIHTVMTMGYDVPWRQVHELLIKAALMTEGVLNQPEPFVLELELNDNYMCYQINAYITNADDMPVITSDLLQNIQDLFHEAKIDLVAPHFYSSRAGRTPVSSEFHPHIDHLVSKDKK